MMDRLGEWMKFSFQVSKHILKYCIPQYADDNEEMDEAGCWTSAQCIESIRRYVKRFGKNARGPKEALRDMLKIAHYACIAYFKLREELKEPDVYLELVSMEYGGERTDSVEACCR